MAMDITIPGTGTTKEDTDIIKEAMEGAITADTTNRATITMAIRTTPTETPQPKMPETAAPA